MHQLTSPNQEIDLLPSTDPPRPDSPYDEIEFLTDRSGMETTPLLQEPYSQIQEILKNFAYDSPLSIDITPQPQNPAGDKPPLEKLQKLQEGDHRKKHKKIKKAENSPFHNYQKHLNNALKKLIIVPESQPHDGPQKLAAIQIWKAYCQSEIKTKRILHFVFNQRNEHPINEAELRTCGLLTAYRTFGEATAAQARTYLSRLAIDQIDPQNVEGYLRARKLKSKDGFGRYLMAFRAELEKGYLKRRINAEK